MRGLLRHSGVVWASRWLLAGVFLLAAWYKLGDLAAFATSIKYYDMVPLAWIPLFATVLAGSEASVGIALATGRWGRGASVVVTAMLLVFLAALITAYARGLSIDCGCFAADLSPERAADVRDHMLTRIGQDFGLLAVAINLVVTEWRREEMS